MSDPNQPSTPPGWYPDGQGGQRWWDGNQWTEHTQPPSGGAPAAPAAPAAPSAPSAPGVPGGDLPTQVAPNRASNYPAQPQQPQQPQYGAPAGGGYGQPAGQPGFGQQPPFGGYPSTGGSSGGGKGKLIAIIGAAVGAVILVVVLLFVLFKVVLGGGPGGVAEDYLNAQLDRDYEKQCDLSAEKLQDELLASADADDCGDYADKQEDAEKEFEDQIKEFEDILDDTDIEIEAGDVKEDGDKATVDVTIKYEYTGDDDDKFREFFNEEKLEGEDEGKVKLVKEDGDWKVEGTEGDI